MFYDGQDHGITELIIARTHMATNTETIRAKFKNFEKTQRVDYLFKRTELGWRIDDIKHDGESLRGLMLKPCAE